MNVEFLEPNGELTAGLLLDVLGLVMADPPHLNIIERWTVFERLLVYDYAMREHSYASDGQIDRRPKPSFIEGDVLSSRLIDLDAAWTAGVDSRGVTPSVNRVLSAASGVISTFRRRLRGG